MPPNALVLVFDRLQAGYLGPYGNLTVITPAWNALAAESLLLENHLSDTPEPASVYRSWWTGGHVWSPAVGEAALADLLAEQDVHTALITDDAPLLEQPLARSFAERIVVRGDAQASQPADNPNDCQMARVLEAALRWLDDDPPEPFLCWVHARAMAAPWDAPYEMRLALADEDDPEPPRFVQPPELLLPADYDPDELLGVTQAYGAQAMLLDMCLGSLLESFQESPLAERTLLACTSPRGYPLGEHQLVGGGGELLTSESLHTPLMVRFPAGEAAAVRERSLGHPADLYATLREWFELPPAPATCWRQSLLPLQGGALPSARSEHAMAGGKRAALRTPEWLLIVEQQLLHVAVAGDDLSIVDRRGTQLYAKPDDRYEFNNVNELCAREAVELLEQLRALRQRI